MYKNEESHQGSNINPDAVLQSLDFIRQYLGPSKFTLTDADRVKILKMGDSARLFVEMILDFMESNPEFISPLIKPEEMKAKFERYKQILPVLREFKQIKRNLEDELMVLGADLVGDANNYYNSVNRAKKMGIPDAKPIYEELQKRYAHKAKRKTNPESSSE